MKFEPEDPRGPAGDAGGQEGQPGCAEVCSIGQANQQACVLGMWHGASAELHHGVAGLYRSVLRKSRQPCYPAVGFTVSGVQGSYPHLTQQAWLSLSVMQRALLQLRVLKTPGGSMNKTVERKEASTAQIQLVRPAEVFGLVWLCV